MNMKTGLYLLILGNVLNISYIYFCANETNSFGEFTSGLLLGLSIGCNLVGIIIIVMNLPKDKKK